MRCFNPRRLPNPAANGIEDAFIQTGCGKCYGCLSNRRRGWLFRLYNEHLSSLFSLFVTFTYSDDYCDGYLHKDHFQKFIKRLRKYEDIVYYAIGEYGTTTYRPHYHAVIFFKSADTDESVLSYYLLVNSLWYYGFAYPCRVTYRRLNYVLHYHVRPKEPVEGKHTFQLFSKGLGLSFLDDNIIQYLVDTKATTIRDFNGNIYVIPRYYRKKLIEIGYDIEVPRSYDKDYSVLRIEKVFHKKIYEIPDRLIASYIKDLKNKSDKKIAKYNHQDKYV